jgi:hypothetical protein
VILDGVAEKATRHIRFDLLFIESYVEKSEEGSAKSTSRRAGQSRLHDGVRNLARFQPIFFFNKIRERPNNSRILMLSYTAIGNSRIVWPITKSMAIESEESMRSAPFRADSLAPSHA